MSHLEPFPLNLTFYLICNRFSRNFGLERFVIRSYSEYYLGSRKVEYYTYFYCHKESQKFLQWFLSYFIYVCITLTNFIFKIRQNPSFYWFFLVVTGNQ